MGSNVCIYMPTWADTYDEFSLFLGLVSCKEKALADKNALQESVAPLTK